MQLRTTLLPALALALLTPGPAAEAQGERRGAVRDDTIGIRADTIGIRAEPEAPGIAWFGVWDDARAEAARTGRPILLMSAAPRCREVPGVW